MLAYITLFIIFFIVISFIYYFFLILFFATGALEEYAKTKKDFLYALIPFGILFVVLKIEYKKLKD